MMRERNIGFFYEIGMGVGRFWRFFDFLSCLVYLKGVDVIDEKAMGYEKEEWAL